MDWLDSVCTSLHHHEVGTNCNAVISNCDNALYNRLLTNSFLLLICCLSASQAFFKASALEQICVLYCTVLVQLVCQVQEAQVELDITDIELDSEVLVVLTYFHLPTSQIRTELN